MLRMELPHTTEISIWDTAAPPDLTSFHLLLGNHTVRHFHSIDLHKIFGLTFLMSDIGLYDIHGHTREQPSAADAVEHLVPRHRRGLHRLFVPLPPGEKILAIGVRGQTHSTPCFLVRPLPTLR